MLTPHGTRYNIHVDSSDGLLYAGEPGVQLTWMDVKIGDWVVTPRVGKPVEVNALWLNAVSTQAKFAGSAGKLCCAVRGPPPRKLARAFSASGTPRQTVALMFIDGPEGNDASVRPNQILAVALEDSR